MKSRFMRLVCVLLLACGGEVSPTAEDETATGASENAPPETMEATESTETSEAADEPDTIEAADEPDVPTPTSEPTVFTRVSFDLRGMPHRGPRDVDPAHIQSRTELLMQDVRDAAGEPEPRLTYQRGVSVFRAEFFGSVPDALEQCRRAVQEVAPELDPSLSPRAALREPRATPCAPITSE